MGRVITYVWWAGRWLAEALIGVYRVGVPTREGAGVVWGPGGHGQAATTPGLAFAMCIIAIGASGVLIVF